MTDQHQPAAVAPGLSEAEIEAIRRRVEWATRGPWRACSDGTEESIEAEALGRFVCHLNSNMHRYRDDAAFIAHARLDVPRLLAELDATRAEAEALLATMGASTLRCLELEQQRDEARAEAAALRTAVQVELHIDEQETRSRCSEMPKHMADWHVRESLRGKRLRKALAAPQSEQPQPAAPVDRSAEGSDGAR